MVHIFKVRGLISTLPSFIRCVKSDLHTIVSVVLSDSMLLDKNKKSSSFRLDMMDTVVISLLKKQKKEKQMEKSVPYDSKYQKEKSLS